MYCATAGPRVEAVPCEEAVLCERTCAHRSVVPLRGGGNHEGGSSSVRWGRGSVRRYRERERTVRERESIVEAVPREDILRIAEPVAVPQKRGVL